MSEKTAIDVSHLIEIRDLGKTYSSGTSQVTAIDGMGFGIDDGEFITIMGQSGSGKSTLLSILGAMNRPSRGQVLVDSLDLYALTNEQRADFRSEYMGFIFQSFQLIPYLTVLENVTLPMAITGRKKKIKKAMAMSVIERVGLEEKAGRLPDQLSGGAGAGGHSPGHCEPPAHHSGRRAHGKSGLFNRRGNHVPSQGVEQGGPHHYHGHP